MRTIRRLWYKLKVFLHLYKPARKSGPEALLELVPVIVAACVILSAVSWLFKVKAKRKPYLWIESPNGKYYKFPLYQSLRILRKQKGWEVAKVEPILTKWQAVKRILGTY
jgi:hypothetical protein